MFEHGIFRLNITAPKVTIGNPAENAKASICAVDNANADLVLLPELGLSGYTCGDLFGSDTLLRGSIDALIEIRNHSAKHKKTVVVGLPLVVAGSLMNVAAVVQNGRVAGIVPKSFLPNYREFYEARHFRAASKSDPTFIDIDGDEIPLGTDLLFRMGDAVIAIEICEDVWTPIPPSCAAAVAGANVLLNLSASNETIGKVAWRRDLVRSQSGRCIAAYAYCSSGPTESTSDLVFGGHCLVAENGSMIGESRRVGDGLQPHVQETSITCDIDLERLAHDRRVIGSFDDVRDSLGKEFRTIPLDDDSENRSARSDLLRRVDAHPFVPDESRELDARCAEVIGIQTAGLVKRLSCISESTPLTIGVSGGLDSTLALLVALQACDAIGRPRSAIHGITMPGFGTTKHTKTSADQLIELTGITGECIDIRELCLDTFRSLEHSPLGIKIDESTTADSLHADLIARSNENASDLTFENVQARVRTMLLMSRGFVLGTGDMSEQALGWCTYNADHMSMYNVNTSIPKTLVKFLVRYAADNYYQDSLQSLLHRVADTTISPELMPASPEGEILQDTEASIGAYELHDFFLYHFVRNGFSKEKILFLASHASFDQEYTGEHIAETFDTFIRRFFFNQFKRNCVPDGPKVGSVSLSPRGDWRMPSDADWHRFG